MRNIKSLSKSIAIVSASLLLIGAMASSADAAGKPTPKPTSKTVVYNDLDAAAITGGFALARGLPSSKDTANLSLFVANLKKNQGLTSKSTLDIGVQGNILVEYVVDPAKGSSAPFCFTVKPPLAAKGNPGQAQWTFYMSPASGTLKDLVLIQQGYSTCAQAAAFAKNIPAAKRSSYASESLSLAKTSILRMPATLLTPMGLVMLDDARGLLKAPIK